LHLLSQSNTFLQGQGGLDAAHAADFATTTLNPVLLDSVGTWLLMYNIPSLPQVIGHGSRATGAGRHANDTETRIQSTQGGRI
jgi:hypothetical protein